ncbi:MAG: FAD-dependent oxidoreductase [Deltaproteobacteria bacterium]|nr:FAD-dependent oxidoreductase [Deltaproteobacteria bacterium]
MLTEYIHTAVIGAGLSGLAFASEFDSSRVRVFERSSHPGGKASSVRVGTSTFDCTGHWLHLRKGKFRDKFLKNFPGKLLEVERKALVFIDNHYMPYPFQAHLFHLGAEKSARLLESFLEKKTTEDTSFEGLLKNAFGDEMYSVFFEPYNKKIWGIHPSKLAGSLTARYVPVPHDDEIITGAKTDRVTGIGYNQILYYPDRGGIGTIAQYLADQLDDGVLSTNSEITGVDTENKMITVNNRKKVRYEHLVSTAFLPDFFNLLKAPPMGKLNLSYRNLSFADVTIKRNPDVVDFHWAYVVDPEIPVYRVGLYSAVAPYMAAKGEHSVYVEFTDDIDDLSAAEKSVRELFLRMNLIETEEDIKYLKLRRIKGAYPHFDENYIRVIDALRKYLEKQDVYLLGRFGSFIYSSMGEDMENAVSLAERLNNE